MAANKRKILEAARKHAQKGAKEKALKEFGKLLKLDPRDSKVRLELGDTHRRWGQVAEAIESYSNVAEQFMQEGFDARAVAVFKQIQNLQPEAFSYHEPLAELYQRMGLTAEAIACLETAAESYRVAGQKQEALGLLRKMAAIDPSNTTSRIKVADLLQQEGMKEDAVSEYDAVVAELELQGDAEAAAKLFERILEIQPERIETLVLYARNLIDRGSAQRAESLAKRALELDRSPEQYELLADVYRMDKREEELVTLYRELAELYRERGDEDRTREILQRYVPLDEIGSSDTPNGYISEDEKLSEGESPTEDGGLSDDLSIGDETTLLDGDLLSDPTLLVSEADSELGMLSEDDDLNVLNSDNLDTHSDSNEMTCLLPDDPPGGTSSGGAADGGAKIDDGQLLVEASVYLRYGKRSQAISNLESILERDANHRPALEKLGEALSEGDDSSKAVEMWSRAAKLAAESGEADAAEVLRSRIAALDPAAAEALDLAVASAPDPDTGERVAANDLIDEAGDDLSMSDDLIGEAGDDLLSSDALIDDASDDLLSSDVLIDDASDDLSSSDVLIEEASDELSTSDVLADGASDELSLSDDLIDEASDDLLTSEDLTAAPSDDGSKNQDATALPELDLAEVSISDLEIEIDIDDASFALEFSDEEEPSEPEVETAAEGPESIADAEMEEFSIEDLSVTSDAEKSGEAENDAEGADREALEVGGAVGGDVSPEKIAEDLEEADFYMEQGLLDEAEAAYSKILSKIPNHPHAMVRLGELASQRGDAPGAATSASDPATQAADSADSVSAEPPFSDIGADLADWQDDLLEDEAQEADEQSDGTDSATPTLEESSDSAVAEVEDAGTVGDLDGEEAGVGEESVAAESGLATELAPKGLAGLDRGSEADELDSASVDEQDETGELPVVSVTPDVPSEPAESEELESVEALESPAETISEASDGDGESVESGDNLGFDLAAELGDTFDHDPGASSSGSTGSAARGGTSEDGFASVFAEFKKGVSETLTEGDHQAHYDLGIAYREMGLLSDAFAEFQLAMEAPERRTGCLQLMGMCAHDMGEPEQAVGHFTEALASDGVSGDALLAITLDLGKAHETAGDVASARRAYEEVQVIDPAFADVASRLDELAKSEDTEPEDDGTADTEEYETFAEFLEDDDELDAAEPEAVAGSTSEAEKGPVWETFDDLVAEIDAEDRADSSSEEQEAKASVEPAPEDPKTAGKTKKTSKKRKKKISFV